MTLKIDLFHENWEMPNCRTIIWCQKYKSTTEKMTRLSAWTVIKLTWTWEAPSLLWNAELPDLSRAMKIWYSKLPLGSIRNWLEFKSTFLKRFAINKVGEAPINVSRIWGSNPGNPWKAFYLSSLLKWHFVYKLLIVRLGQNWEEVQTWIPFLEGCTKSGFQLTMTHCWNW